VYRSQTIIKAWLQQLKDNTEFTINKKIQGLKPKNLNIYE
jgi:hypothetical protein